MIKPFVNNEFSKIQQVVLGVGDDFGGCPLLSDAYDPKSKEHILSQTFPKESDITTELNQFLAVFKKYNVDVLRPKNIFNCNQIFTRDVGFVIENSFFVANMINNRKDEILGFDFILKQMHSSSVHLIPDDIFIEGGDVIVGENYLFIGFSNEDDFKKYQVSRTNERALVFLKTKFPNKEVVGFQLNKSDKNPRANCLHLDCCFQPLGLGHVLIYPDGFKLKSDLNLVESIFGKDKIISIDRDEMYYMFSNIFSISKNVIVSDRKFKRLNNLLTEKGYVVEEISFSEISKMGGLLRCATLPLVR